MQIQITVISELLRIKSNHYQIGYFDIKINKIFPKKGSSAKKN